MKGDRCRPTFLFEGRPVGPTPLSMLIEKRCLCLFPCAVDYVERKRLRDSERTVLHRAKSLAAARPELEAALASGAGRGASPASEAQAVEDSEEVKRPVDYPWDWVSPQLLNCKGGEIYLIVLTAELEVLREDPHLVRDPIVLGDVLVPAPDLKPLQGRPSKLLEVAQEVQDCSGPLMRPVLERVGLGLGADFPPVLESFTYFVIINPEGAHLVRVGCVLTLGFDLVKGRARGARGDARGSLDTIAGQEAGPSPQELLAVSRRLLNLHKLALDPYIV